MYFCGISLDPLKFNNEIILRKRILCCEQTVPCDETSDSEIQFYVGNLNRISVLDFRLPLAKGISCKNHE